MDILQARGYQEIVGTERTSLKNGTQLRSIALSNNIDQQIKLTLIEEQDGANGAHVLEFPSDDSMVIWDQSGRLELT